MKSGPVLSISESLLLHNFYEGLDKDSTYYLDVATGGSFLHRSPAECREILDDIMIRTDFTVRCEPLQEERKSSQEELPAAESNPLPCTSLDSAIGPSPEPRTSEGEEIQPPEFFSRFEDDSLGNIRNTLNHLRHEKPTTSLCPYKAIDEISHHAPTMDCSKEARRTSEAIRISPTSTIIPCLMR